MRLCSEELHQEKQYPVLIYKKKKKAKATINFFQKEKTGKEEKTHKKEQRKSKRDFFIFLNSDLYHTLTWFLNNVIAVFTLFQTEIPRVHRLKWIRFFKADIIKALDSVFWWTMQKYL